MEYCSSWSVWTSFSVSRRSLIRTRIPSARVLRKSVVIVLLRTATTIRGRYVVTSRKYALDKVLQNRILGKVVVDKDLQPIAKNGMVFAEESLCGR